MFGGLIIFILAGCPQPLSGHVYIDDVGVAKWGPDGPRNNWLILPETLPPPPQSTSLRADFNLDGVVNSQDFMDFMAAWSQEANNGGQQR